MKLRYRLLIAGLLVVTLASLGLNAYLYRLAREFYRQTGSMTLDPLNLNGAIPPTDLDAADTVIVLYGDSRAAVWPNPATNEDYVFVNLGIGSQSSLHVNLRFPYHVSPVNPDVMLLQVGINDLKFIPMFNWRRESIVENCKENIREIVEAAREMGIHVVLTTIFPVGDPPLERIPIWSDDIRIAVDEVNAYIHTLAGEDVTLFDTYELLAREDGKIRPEYATDELHINVAAYDMLNEALMSVLAEVTGEDAT